MRDVEKKLLTTPGPACDVRGDCGLNLVRTFNADFGASAIIWKPTTKNGPPSAAVFLFAAGGKRFEGRADVRNDDLRSAIDEATAKAVHAKRIEMPVTPARVTVQPAQPVTNSAPPLSTQEAPSKPKHNLVGPLILGGVGLLAVGTGIYTLRPATCDLTAPNGTCLQSSESQPAVGWTMIGVGAAAVAGAIVWYLAPWERGNKQKNTTSVSVGPGSLLMRGTF